MKYSTALAALAALAGVAGCGSGDPPETAKPAENGSLMPPNPKERLNEERMAAATEGLVFETGVVRPARRTTPNRERGESLRRQAQALTEGRNTWFLSVGAYRDAILADPTNARSFEGLAEALLMEGNTGKAEAALQTALRLQPAFSRARYRLGMVRQMEGDYEGAVGHWRLLAQREPGYEDVFARIAIASYYSGDYAESWRSLREAQKRGQPIPPQFPALLKEADAKP